MIFGKLVRRLTLTSWNPYSYRHDDSSYDTARRLIEPEARERVAFSLITELHCE